MSLTSLRTTMGSRSPPCRSPSRGAVSNYTPNSRTPTAMRRRRTERPCGSLFLRAAATRPPPCERRPPAAEVETEAVSTNCGREGSSSKPFQRRLLNLKNEMHHHHLISWESHVDLVFFTFLLQFFSCCCFGGGFVSKARSSAWTSVEAQITWSVSDSTGPQRPDKEEEKGDLSLSLLTASSRYNTEKETVQ